MTSYVVCCIALPFKFTLKMDGQCSAVKLYSNTESTDSNTVSRNLRHFT